MGELLALVGRLFDLPTTALSAASRLDELPGWGSLRALELLVAVEEQTGVRLDLRRVHSGRGSRRAGRPGRRRHILRLVLKPMSGPVMFGLRPWRVCSAVRRSATASG